MPSGYLAAKMPCAKIRDHFVFLNMCKGLRVQLPLSSKLAVKNSYTNFRRDRQSICIGFRPFVPEELDMNLTSVSYTHLTLPTTPYV